MARLERLRRAFLPVALRAVLRTSKIAPGDVVELGAQTCSSTKPSHKKGPFQGPFLWDGAPGEIRTPDRSVRSRVLYPAELQALNFEGAILRMFASICQ